MIYRLSRSIAFYFVKEGIVKKEEADVYRFGIEIILCNLMDIGIVLFTGLIYGQLKDALWYYVVFCCLRNMVEGYHAKTCFGCKCLMFVMMCGVLSFSRILVKYSNICLFLGSVILIMLYIKKAGSGVNNRICLSLIFTISILLTKCYCNVAVLTMLAGIVVIIASKYTVDEKGG